MTAIAPSLFRSPAEAPALRWSVPWARLGLAVLVSGALAGCGMGKLMRGDDITSAVRAELPPRAAAPAAPAPVPAQVSEALAEPVAPAAKVVPEPRIDLLVNNAQAREVFLAIVADTRYSMLMHPDVNGTISVTLRGVTVTEALESIRDVYGYDFRIDGRRITVYAPTLQTRIFTINYPNSQRDGSSELRVSSGGPGQRTGSGGTGGGGSQGTRNESSKVSTTSKTDFWSELAAAARGIIGTGDGRNVITSPQAGIIAVRAMPDELRQVERFLKAAQIAVERQVMLEAKVVEVDLREGFQSGVNWGAFGADGSTQAVAGVLGTGIAATNPLLQGGSTIVNGVVPVPSVATGGGLFGLALSTTNFGAVLGFLETQGDVQTLSSPRVATLNNQKAVLKVGTDAYFVTNVMGGSISTGTATAAGSTSLPSVTLTPFFSGISLDVTPQVDDGNMVTLHVHPSISTVTESTKQIDLGTIGNFKLPLASSNVNETDTLVRIQDGRIVAIGGLMQMDSSRNVSGLPGTTGLGAASVLFGNKSSAGRKREVIVLIKPTIIRGNADWDEQNRRARAALEDMEENRARVIRIDGAARP